MTDKDADDLIVRPYHAYDEATPNYNAVAAQAFSEHWILTGDASSRDVADRTLNSFAADVPKNVFGTASLLTALDTRTRFKKLLSFSGMVLRRTKLCRLCTLKLILLFMWMSFLPVQQSQWNWKTQRGTQIKPLSLSVLKKAAPYLQQHLNR